MSFLRTMTTTKLAAAVGGTAALVAGSAVGAIAATSGGSTPPPLPLRQAIHHAVTAPSVSGVSAQVTFTDHLIDSSVVQGSDPLLSGASGRLWAAGDKLRLELQSDNGDDAQVLVDGQQVSIYDTAENTVFKLTLPKSADHSSSSAPPSLGEITTALAKLARSATISGAKPTDVASQPAYSVSLTPKHDGGLLGKLQLAWDAANGVPLQVGIYSSGNSTPVLQLTATGISFGPVAASTFAIPQPNGAKVVDLSPQSSGAGSHQTVTGVGPVSARLSFKLAAPATLAGLPQHEVRLVKDGDSAGALVTYGQGLGAIVVLETAAGTSTPTGKAGGSGSSGLSLPTVSIDGATGQELDTALGTVVEFSTGGVSYTVIGSVPPVAAEAAARSIG